MASTTVYTLREMNLGQCTFTSPEKFDGYNESFVTINGVKGFVLQSPKLILRNSTDSYFEFLVSRNKDRHREFYNIISHLEDMAILQITQNSLEWFGKEIKREWAETMFRSVIHRPLDVNDSYTIRINKAEGVEAEINFPVVCLIRINGIIFGKRTSTLDIKVVQAKVVKQDKIENPVSTEGTIANNVDNAEQSFYHDNKSIVPHDFSRTDIPPPPSSPTLPKISEEFEQMCGEEKEEVREVSLSGNEVGTGMRTETDANMLRCEIMQLILGKDINTLKKTLSILRE